MKKVWIQLGIFLIVAIGAVAIFSSLRFTETVKNPAPANVVTVPVEPTPAETNPNLSHYIEIIDGCNWAFYGSCVNMRSGPSLSAPVILRLRTGIVFKVEKDTVEGDGHDWYKVVFDDDVRYPERVASAWYVAADPETIRPFDDAGEVDLKPGTETPTNKHIIVNLSTETLTAYDGDDIFMEELISTGVEPTITAPGTFTIYKKMPSRYMQGPLPDISDEYYDLPGVAWDLYFTKDGAVLHAAYWHNNFGHPMSHGCVNQSPESAKKLYEWADVGTPVTVVP